MEQIIWLPSMYADGDESGCGGWLYDGELVQIAYGPQMPDGEYGSEEIDRIPGPATLEDALARCKELSALDKGEADR